MRGFKIGLLVFNFLAAKKYVVETEVEDGASDYSLGHDPELLNREMRAMWSFLFKNPGKLKNDF